MISDNAAFKFNSDGAIRWQNNKVAILVQGDNLYSPKISVNNSELLLDEHIKQIELRINEAVEKNIKDILSEAINLKKPVIDKKVNLDNNDEKNIITETDEIFKKDYIVSDNNLSGKALGIAYEVYEGMGSAKTSNLSMSINKLSENDKRNLAKLGLRLGVETIYLPNFLKPSSINLRALLWSVYNHNFPEQGPPPDGRVSVIIGPDANHDYYRALGFVPLGNLALRADIALGKDVATDKDFTVASATGEALSNAIKRLGNLEKSLDRTMVAPGEHDTQFAALRAALLSLDSRLNGNPAKKAVGAWSGMSIGDRLSHVTIGTFRSTYGPTPAIKESLNIARDELKVARDELDALLTQDIPAFEQRLQTLGAPWLPGQKLPAL